MKIAYQGLAGAYSEAACAALFPGAEYVGQRTFLDVFDALTSGSADAAVLPMENSHAGSVVEVYDLLHARRGITIVAEAIVRVRYCLLGVPGATIADVKRVRSHPQSLSQCAEWLREHSIEPEVAFDNAGAAAEVAAARERSVAGLASRRAGRHYGLNVLAEGVETSPNNFTRFVAVVPEGQIARASAIPAALRSGPLKTSLIYALQNMPGALTRSLQPFATAGLQLTKIESRPSKDGPWDYVFYLDFEGDPASSPATEALALMKTCCRWIEVFGTYPAATTPLEPD